MMKTTSFVSKILLVFLVAALICVPATAHEESAGDIAADMIKNVEEIIVLCGEIHDQTEYIADDESLPEELCELAEGIHVFSHELESVADHILGHVQKLQTLVASGSGDNAAIEQQIDLVNKYSDDFVALLGTKHEDIHDLCFNVPESHESYADATHDAAHAAGDAAKHIITQTAELKDMLVNAPAAASSSTSQNTGVAATDVTAEVAEISEHCDDLFTSAESILLETKAIVKDDTVDQDIRDLAKTIHLVSHELEDIAADLQKKSAELQTLAADPRANKDAMKVIIVDMQTSVAEYVEKFESQHKNIHELVNVAPESRKDNADAVHDAGHAAKKTAGSLTGHLNGLEAALDAPAPANPESMPMPAPGFGVLAAICGVFGAVVYAARRE